MQHLKTRPRLHSIHRAVRALVGKPLAFGLCLAAPLAGAAPQAGTVVAGQANVSRSGNLTTVVQGSARAVIDWRSFSVAANEGVAFRQPDARAAILNRVVGGDPSAILGRITANGSVFLVNANGILFGAGAQVNVGGLVASTANIGNANFMAGDLRFDQPGRADARVENQGTLRIADGGIAVLAGRQVANSGFIVGRLGKVALAGVDTFVLDLAGDRLLTIALDPAAMEREVDASGVPLVARVDNTGSLRADGGLVQLSAATVSRLLDNVINVQGDIRATAVGVRDGVISLTGGSSADVTVGGVLQAGRTIAIEGRSVQLAPTAQVDLGTAANLDVVSSRGTVVDTALITLRADGPSTGHISLKAGTVLDLRKHVAVDQGALTLLAGGMLSAATGVTLQSGAQPLVLQGDQGVAVDRVLSSGRIEITSGTGSVTVASALAAPSPDTTARAATAIIVHAAQGVQLNGAFASDAIDVRAGGDLVSAGLVRSQRGGVVLQAGGSLAAEAVTAPVALDLSAGGSLTVAEALGAETDGRSASVQVRAGGGVRLAGVRAGPQGIVIESTRGGVVSGTLDGLGGVFVTAGGGRLDGAAGPLDITSGGGVTVHARDGLAIGTVFAPGTVHLGSATGDVAAGWIAGGAGDIVSAAPARGLSVAAGGAVTLGGARLGAGGLAVAGAGGRGGAGQFRLRGGSVWTDGGVDVTSTGPVNLEASVKAGGPVQLRSTTAGIAIGAAGVQATGAGQGVTVTARDAVTLDGPVLAHDAPITVRSQAGSVTAKVRTAGQITEGDALLDAGQDQAAASITVAAAGDVILGGMKAARDIDVTSNTGSVLLLSPLGGEQTGYANIADGYQDAAAARPDVGAVRVTAKAGSVELNGLNLDGLRDAQADGYGLNVEAGGWIVSNTKIAVNKGHLRLKGGDDPGEGVLLGDAVYSRGWDSGGGGTLTNRPAGYQKIGYGILIDGHTLGLFDNTADVANLPGMYRVDDVRHGAPATSVWVNGEGLVVDRNNRVQTPRSMVTCDAGTGCSVVPVVAPASETDPLAATLGVPVYRQIAKIEVSNNPANYTNSSTLVPAKELKAMAAGEPGGLVSIKTTNIDGLAGPAGRRSVRDGAPTYVRLSEAPSQSSAGGDMAAAVSSDQGIALKVLGFASPQRDQSTQLWGREMLIGRAARADEGVPDNVLSGISMYPTTVEPVDAQGQFLIHDTGHAHNVFLDGDDSSLFHLPDTATVTYRFELVPGAPYYAVLKEVVFPTQPAGVDTSNWVSGAFAPSPIHVGDIFQVRIPPNGAPTVVPGRAEAVRIAGSVSGPGTSRSDVQVDGSGTLTGRAPHDALIPEYRQVLSAPLYPYQITGDSNRGWSHAYGIGTAIASVQPTGPLAGTRVIVFDGVLLTSDAGTIADSANGNFLPGATPTIEQPNSSQTGFSPVRTPTVGTAGSGSTFNAGLTPTTASGTAGTAFGGGAGTGAGVPVDPGFTFVPDPARPPPDPASVLRAAIDATSAPGGTATLLGALLQSIEWGTSPAAQADFGRSGGMAGAVRNVFSRAYRLATSEDGKVCVPGSIGSTGGGSSGEGGAAGCAP